jgi:hypothetical protein
VLWIQQWILVQLINVLNIVVTIYTTFVNVKTSLHFASTVYFRISQDYLNEQRHLPDTTNNTVFIMERAVFSVKYGMNLDTLQASIGSGVRFVFVSQRRPWFTSGTVSMRFMVEKLPLGQVFFRVLLLYRTCQYHSSKAPYSYLLVVLSEGQAGEAWKP